MAVDGGHVYWSNSSAGAIGRANLDGSGVEQSFISTAGIPQGVAVDGGYIYWANFSWPAWPAGTIGRANLNGSGVEQSFITGLTNPNGVAVDGGHVYSTSFLQVRRSGADRLGEPVLDRVLVDEQHPCVPAAGPGVGVGRLQVAHELAPLREPLRGRRQPLLSLPSTSRKSFSVRSAQSTSVNPSNAHHCRRDPSAP